MEAHSSSHAEQRLFERFNLIMDDEMAKQLAGLIDQGSTAFLGIQDNSRELHAVEIAGRTIVVVWQPSNRTFITVLHPDEFRSRLKCLGSMRAPRRRPDRKPAPVTSVIAVPAPRCEPTPSTQEGAERKLARQRAHQERVAQREAWLEQMAQQQLRTRKAWFLLDRGIAPTAMPVICADPVHPGVVKFYHATDTNPQNACTHVWVEGTTDVYCLECQLQKSRAVL